MSDHRGGHPDDALGYTTDIHQFPGKDEQGNCQQNEGVDAGCHLLRKQHVWHAAAGKLIEEQIAKTGNTNCPGDFHSDQGEYKQKNQQGDQQHLAIPRTAFAIFNKPAKHDSDLIKCHQRASDGQRGVGPGIAPSRREHGSACL